MKRVLLTLLAVFVVFGIVQNVYAEEVYYTNQNGIELTQDEYEFLTKFYGPYYTDNMTKAMYDEFVEYDLMNSDVEIKKYTVPALPLLGNGSKSPNHVTPAKTLQIGRACFPTFCIMSLQNTWTQSPYVRSWDNIGVYLDGVSLISHDGTYVGSTAGADWYENLKTESDGVGNSVKLPDVGENIIIDMAFKVTRGGTVYGSYQHAMQNTTLLNSQNYTIDYMGYGGVFLYYGNAVGVYDGMNGVDIDV